jgi:hypothetical protein
MLAALQIAFTNAFSARRFFSRADAPAQQAAGKRVRLLLKLTSAEDDYATGVNSPELQRKPLSRQIY